jgi:cell division protein FtsZ
MPPDPPLDRITAIIAAITGLVTGPPNLIGFDFADLRAGLIEGGLAVFGQGEASGPDRAIRAAEAALADIRQQLRDRPGPGRN